MTLKKNIVCSVVGSSCKNARCSNRKSHNLHASINLSKSQIHKLKYSIKFNTLNRIEVVTSYPHNSRNECIFISKSFPVCWAFWTIVGSSFNLLFYFSKYIKRMRCPLNKIENTIAFARDDRMRYPVILLTFYFWALFLENKKY